MRIILLRPYGLRRTKQKQLVYKDKNDPLAVGGSFLYSNGL